MSSFGDADPKEPGGHCEHAVPTENGSNSGFDMKLPAGQHPYRPLVPLAEGNARDHCPPHNVRLKPLLVKTGKKEEEKAMGV